MDPKKPYAPLGDTNAAGSAAKGQHRFGWYMVGAGVLLMLALGLWLSKLQDEALVQNSQDGKEKEAVLEPDGPMAPGPQVGVAFGHQSCIPWNVSAASPVPPASSRFIVVTSRLADPYAYVAAGFGKDCGSMVSQVLIAEDSKPDRLRTLVSEIKPSSILAVGEASAKLVKKTLPDQSMLYAMVQAPGESGLERPGLVGVIPEVPVSVAIRRMVGTLPRKAKKIGVVYSKGSFSSLAKDAMGQLNSMGRKGIEIGLRAPDDMDEGLKNIGDLNALVVLIDGKIIDERSLGRIFIMAENAKIPVCVSDERHVMLGAYVGIGVDSYRIGRQLCHLAGAMVRGEIPDGDRVFCPEYSFGVLNNAVMEKLGYMLDPVQFKQVKLYKWK